MLKIIYLCNINRNPKLKITMAKRQKKDLWWYIKKEYGISGLKRKFTKQTGIPLTKAGVERKLGALLLDWVLGRGKKAAAEVEEVEEEEE